MGFNIPETKGLPLEEIAAIFGDTEEVMVYARDIHVDHNTHNLVVNKHSADGKDLEGDATHVVFVEEEGKNVKPPMATDTKAA